MKKLNICGKNIKQLKYDLKYKHIFDQCGRNFSKISKLDNLPEDFIDFYFDRLNLRFVCKHSKLSEQFILNHLLDFKQSFCLKVIEKYQDHLSQQFKDQLKNVK